MELLTTPGSSRQDKIYNFLSCIIDSVGFPLGIAFFSTTTIFPAFLRKLGASDITIGALSSMINLLIFLPGFLVIGYLNRKKRVRGFLFWVAIGERIALLPMVFLTPLWAFSHPDWLIAAVFLSYGMHGIAMGLNQPGYWTAVSKTIPAHWRGRLYGYAGGIAGILGLGIGRLMDHYLSGPNSGFPNGFSACFLIGFIILTVSMMPLGALREPLSDVVTDNNIRPVQQLKSMVAIWHSDASFRWYMIAAITSQIAALSNQYYILYAGKRFGDANLAGFTAIMVFIGSLSSLFWGAWADKAGNKIILLTASLLSLLPPVLALTASADWAFYGVFGAMALSSAGIGIATFNIIMEFAGDTRYTGVYTATANAVSAVPRAFAPFLGGVIASLTGSYRICFIVSAAFILSSILLFYVIQEPRMRSDGTIRPLETE